MEARMNYRGRNTLEETNCKPPGKREVLGEITGSGAGFFNAPGISTLDRSRTRRLGDIFIDVPARKKEY